MWIKRANFLIVRFRINRCFFPLIVIPFRCLDELVEGAMDFMTLFRIVPLRFMPAVALVQNFFEEMQAYGKLDLVDIDAYNQDGRVRISVLMR